MNGKEINIDCPLEDYSIKFEPCSTEDLEEIVSYLGSSDCLKNGIKASYQGVRGCVTKGRVDLCKAGLGVSGLESVLGALQNGKNPFLKSLLLGTNGFGDEGMQNIARFIKDSPVLETLYLGCNKISEEGTKELTNALVVNDSVKALWLKRNRIGDIGVGHIASMLESRDIRTLDLVNTGMSIHGFSRLVHSIIHNKSDVENLYLGGNGFDIRHTSLLMKLIEKSRIKRLYLGVSRLGDEGGKVLLDNIGFKNELELLCLRSNGFTEKLKPSLKNLECSNLKYLYFGKSKSEKKLGSTRNQLGDSAALVGEAIAKLKVLDLNSNGIGHEAAATLIESYENSVSMNYLNLSSNNLLRVQKRKLRALNDAHKSDYIRPNADAEQIISEGRLLV